MRWRERLALAFCLLIAGSGVYAQLRTVWQRPAISFSEKMFPLPDGSGVFFTGHHGWVSYLLPLPDGRLLRQVFYGEEVASITPDGHWLLTIKKWGTERRFRIWQLPDFTLYREIDIPDIGGESQYVTSVHLTPDGTHILAAMYGCDWYYYTCYPEVYAIMLIRIADNQIVWSRSQPEGLNLLVLSPDGQLALVENDYEVQLWRVADGTMQYELDISVDCATFSPDGQLFALGRWDGTITLHQTSDGTLVRTMRVPNDRYAIQLHFSPNGSYLASLSSDQRVHIWDVSRGTLIRSLIPHNERTRHMLFYTDSQVLTIGEDVSALLESIRLWDPLTGRLVQQWAWMWYGADLVRFSPDGQTLGTVTNRYYWSIFVSWSAPEGALRNWFNPVYGVPNRAITSFEFMGGESAIVTADMGRMLQLWDVRSRSLRWSVQAHTDGLTDIALPPHGSRIATASYERVLKWWNAANGTLLNSFGGHLGGVTAIDLSPDGALLASASYDGTVCLWQPATGTLLRTLTGHHGVVWDVAFLPSSNALVSAGADGTLRLWNITTGTTLRVWQAHAGGVYRLSVAPNGKIIASFGEDGALRFWTHTGELLWIYSPAFDLASFAFSPQFPYFAYSIRSDYAGGSLLVMAMFSIPGDVDGDGCVSDSDLLQVLFAFGQTGDWPADVDGNGVVDDSDLLIVLLRFGTGC